MCFIEHVLSLKVKTLPFGPVALTVALGTDNDRLSEHGVTETPWSFLQAMGSTRSAVGGFLEKPSAALEGA
jgi:hypothetical protein